MTAIDVYRNLLKTAHDALDGTVAGVTTARAVGRMKLHAESASHPIMPVTRIRQCARLIMPIPY